jgi:hypothetical protein
MTSRKHGERYQALQKKLLTLAPIMPLTTPVAFCGLANLPNFALDRLSRYEAAVTAVRTSNTEHCSVPAMVLLQVE